MDWPSHVTTHLLSIPWLSSGRVPAGLPAVLAGALLCSPAGATAPVLFHTAGYQAPVHAAPDDLLYLPGDGFRTGDRVVYQADDPHGPGSHPGRIPARTDASSGLAAVIAVGSGGQSLTVRFPQALSADSVYRLWVVTASGEWSRPIRLNDPRPLWISPGYIFATRDPFATHAPGDPRRLIRVIGRNLSATRRAVTAIRLQGPADYVLAVGDDSGPPELRPYVSEAALPDAMKPGWYTVSVGCDGCTWTPVARQRFEVRPDPPATPQLDLSDTRFGSCRPDDDKDDSDCFERALEAARQLRNAVTVIIPAGKWRLSHADAQPSGTGGFVLPPGVGLRGAGRDATTLVWQSRTDSMASTPLLILTGHNAVTGITFTDAERFASPTQSRAILQLGTQSDAQIETGVGQAPDTGAKVRNDDRTIDELSITDNRFLPVGSGILDSGRPLAHLLLLRNEFGAYDNALYLAHAPQLADSVIRWNRFLPGSYLDITAHQGTIASQIGSALRVDFSSNEADGASTAALQLPDDPRGFRAAFFWNLQGNHEFALVADNHIRCSGDKDGDGEALAFDGNGNTSGFEAAEPISGAGSDWIAVRDRLTPTQHGRPVAADFYVGHWIFVVAGRGAGQARRITGYSTDPRTSTLTIRVSPAWDVIPAAKAHIIVERQYWQLYVIANRVEHGTPPCRKSNLNGPKGGDIGVWAPSSDTVIAGNRQSDTDGIGFLQSYSARAASCAACDSSASVQTALEIRDNHIDGEYDWASDCSRSGISGEFSASPTPESPPPVLSYGVSIEHNEITRADGIRGGAIDFALTWHSGPPPGRWLLIVNPLISHNTLRELDGGPPRAVCHFGQTARSGIRLEGQDNIRGAILYANRCERVARGVVDSGQATVRVCAPGTAASCECRSEPPDQGSR